MEDFTASTLILSIIITWTIGLTPPLLIRYAFFRRPMAKKPAIGTSAFFWFLNIILFIAMGSKSKTHAVLLLIAFISYKILNKGYTKFKTREDYEKWKAQKTKENEGKHKLKLNITCPHCKENIPNDSSKCPYCAEDVRNYQKAETDKIAIALNQGNKAEQTIISSDASAGEKINSLLDLSQPINDTKADLKNKLGRLDEIFKEGIISAQEYKTKKEKLLEDFLNK
jgi:uncharacterized CHY-type Zn-finger protein